MYPKTCAEARYVRKCILDMKRKRIPCYYHKDRYAAARFNRRLILARKRRNSASYLGKRKSVDVIRTTQHEFPSKKQNYGNLI